jgi:hypothetical protein
MVRVMVITTTTIIQYRSAARDDVPFEMRSGESDILFIYLFIHSFIHSFIFLAPIQVPRRRLTTSRRLERSMEDSGGAVRGMFVYTG